MTDQQTPPKKIRFGFRGRPLSLNRMLNLHWRDRNNITKKLKGEAKRQWENLGEPIFMRPIKIHYEIGFKDINKIRDLDNYYGGSKYYCDALRGSFFFRDDFRWVRDIRVTFHESEFDKVIVNIVDAEEADV